jgi:hypothetical protein
MARIRTVKPEFFRHELLQDLEIELPELKPMLVFIGLWGQCDKNGVFEFKPRQLKLDILPFLDFDMGASLLLLRETKLISLLCHEGKVYGFIPSFKDHQRITGREAQDPAKYPQHTEMTEWNQDGNTGETPGKQQGRQEGKGKEGKGDTTGKQSAELISFFEELWSHYPVKDGKKAAQRHYLATVKTDADMNRIDLALGNYLDHIKDTDLKYVKNGSTWFHNWQDWEDADEK